MKTNVSYYKMLPHALFIMLVCLCSRGYSQPDYVFKNATLVSGTNLTTGAKYKFANVKPGVDAFLTITAITPGVVLTQLDGASGYTETIQPTISIPAWTSGYVEMNIVFVTAGTSIPLIQPHVSVTGIDIDGVKNYDGAGNDLHEFDAFDLNGGLVDFNTIGGELSVSQVGNWYTGTNIGSVDYPGRDTSAKAVMFTVQADNISSLSFRTGINNQTANTASREASLYFKRFVYPNSTLAAGSTVRLKPVREDKAGASAFTILPNIIEGSAKISISASETGWAILEFVDYSGRMVMQQRLAVDKGMNNIPLFNASQLSKGNYVAVLKMDAMVYVNKVIKK